MEGKEAAASLHDGGRTFPYSPAGQCWGSPWNLGGGGLLPPPGVWQPRAKGALTPEISNLENLAPPGLESSSFTAEQHSCPLELFLFISFSCPMQQIISIKVVLNIWCSSRNVNYAIINQR